MPCSVLWRGAFRDHEVDALRGTGPLVEAWSEQVERWSLGWVTAREHDRLMGFANVAWDGRLHAFLLDVVVAADLRRSGLGTALVALATEEARAAGCAWLHVDFEPHLRSFYFEACGFSATAAGLISLS